jgi:hypothetical protein
MPFALSQLAIGGWRLAFDGAPMAITGSPLTTQLLRVAGLTVLAGVVAVLVAAGYRWYFREQLSGGVALLAGLSAVAIYLNTRGALGAVVEGEAAYLEPQAVLFNTVAFLTAALVTPVARRVGDRLATSTVAVAGVTDVEGEVSRLVTTVGRRTTVTLPEEPRIGDIDGYDPVPDSVAETLAGRTFLFPKGLTLEELRGRLVTRLKADYDVGYVDIELAEDGTVEYLALGQRIAGLGPTLGPGTGAVAIRADPPNSASAGDIVQLWSLDGETPARIATAEIRGIAGDVVTVALDSQEAGEIAGGSYRLLTLPVQARHDREFAGLLRAADETMATIAVTEGAALVGQTVREVGATVVAIKPADGTVQPIPPRSRTLEVGDLVYVVANPATIRELEAAGTPT